MSSTKRLTHQEIKEPDHFMTAMERAVRYLTENRTRMIAAAVGLVLLAGAAIAFGSWRRAQVQTSNESLGRLIALSERPVSGTASGLEPEVGKQPFPDLAAQDNAILQETEAVQANLKTAGTLRGAKLLKARALAHRGRHAEAAALYGEVCERTPTDSLGAAACFGAASARGAAGETLAAVEELKRLASAGGPFVPKDLALSGAAELLEQAGDQQGAIQLYQRLVDEMPGTDAARTAEAKVKDLRAKLPAIGSASPAAEAVPMSTPGT